jgi:hypothetical protein
VLISGTCSGGRFILTACADVIVGVSSGGLPRHPLSKTELRAVAPAVAKKRRLEKLLLKPDIVSLLKHNK